MNLFTFWLKALPLTLGIALTLTALCYLMNFYEHIHFFNFKKVLLLKAKDFNAFLLFFLMGFPTILYGIDKLSYKDKGS